MTVEEAQSSCTTDVPVPERFSGALAAQDDVLIEMPMPPRPKRIIRQQVYTFHSGSRAVIVHVRTTCVHVVFAECIAHVQIPDDILNNAALKDAIAVLPDNYNFEVRMGLALLCKLDSCRPTHLVVSWSSSSYLPTFANRHP